MHKLDLTIARLRLLLADITAKQEQFVAMRRQFAEQQARIVSFTVHEDGSVDRALSMMLEIDSRLDTVERSHRHLEAMRQKAQRELDSLLLRAAERGRPPPLWSVIILVVWTNLHASFPVALFEVS